jgi:hypothetical protein
LTSSLLASILTVAALAVPHPDRDPSACAKTFDRPMIIRAIDATFAGTRTVSRAARGRLRRYVRCARPGVASARMHRYWRTAERAWDLRRHPPLSYAVASWYQDSGLTASGWHAAYGVANKYVAFGTRVLFVYHSRTVEAVVDDRGPFIGGRDWDLNQSTAAALGFAGVDVVGYRIVP